MIKQAEGISCRIGLCYIFTPTQLKHTYDPGDGVTGKSSLKLENTTSSLSSECSVLQTAATDASFGLQELIIIWWIFICSDCIK